MDVGEGGELVLLALEGGVQGGVVQLVVFLKHTYEVGSVPEDLELEVGHRRYFLELEEIFREVGVDEHEELKDLQEVEYPP